MREIKGVSDYAGARSREVEGAKFLDAVGRDREADAVRALIAERDDLQRTFDMTWAAQQRAIAAWQERHDEPMTWPDHAVLVDWLLEDRERMRVALKEIAEPTYGTEWTQTDEERAEILGRHLFHKQSLARAALEPRK